MNTEKLLVNFEEMQGVELLSATNSFSMKFLLDFEKSFNDGQTITKIESTSMYAEIREDDEGDIAAYINHDRLECGFFLYQCTEKAVHQLWNGLMHIATMEETIEEDVAEVMKEFSTNEDGSFYYAFF